MYENTTLESSKNEKVLLVKGLSMEDHFQIIRFRAVCRSSTEDHPLSHSPFRSPVEAFLFSVLPDWRAPSVCFLLIRDFGAARLKVGCSMGYPSWLLYSWYNLSVVEFAKMGYELCDQRILAAKVAIAIINPSDKRIICRIFSLALSGADCRRMLFFSFAAFLAAEWASVFLLLQNDRCGRKGTPRCWRYL